MKLYPVMLNLSGKLVVVVGGGEVALRKACDLLDAGAKVRLIAPEIDGRIATLADEKSHEVELINRTYTRGDADGAMLVYSATNDREVNRMVYDECLEKNIFINAVDDPENCSFFVPSWFTRGDLVVAVSTTGASPTMAAQLRHTIEELIPSNIGEVLAVMRRVRELLKKDPAFSHLDSAKRGVILKEIADDPDFISLLGGGSDPHNTLEALKKRFNN